MRIVIFRPGTWNGTRYTKEFCRAMAEAYDPTGGIEAPLVVGHRAWSEAPRDEDELAHGWAQRLEVDGSGKVFAVVPNPSPEMVGWIQTNRLRYLSVEMSYDLNVCGEADLFPAHAGINRDRSTRHRRARSVPHTRGDEPCRLTCSSRGGTIAPRRSRRPARPPSLRFLADPDRSTRIRTVKNE